MWSGEWSRSHLVSDPRHESTVAAENGKFTITQQL
jgi:hypothetical protein